MSIYDLFASPAYKSSRWEEIKEKELATISHEVKSPEDWRKLTERQAFAYLFEHYSDAPNAELFQLCCDLIEGRTKQRSKLNSVKFWLNTFQDHWYKLTNRASKAGKKSGEARAKKASTEWHAEAINHAKSLKELGKEDRNITSIVAERVGKTPQSVRPVLQNAGVINKQRQQ